MLHIFWQKSKWIIVKTVDGDVSMFIREFNDWWIYETGHGSYTSYVDDTWGPSQ